MQQDQINMGTEHHKRLGFCLQYNQCLCALHKLTPGKGTSNNLHKSYQELLKCR